ncbi:Uncharacterized protein GBIM_04137 [Gryllus bimaculatus]|nr:Uncharacterized protein GBIM_04137 [Gryllus bimaculatus]
MERNTSGDGVDEMNKHLKKLSMSSVSEKISDQSNTRRTRSVAKRGNIQTAKTVAASNKPANTSKKSTHQLTEKDILALPIVVPLRDAPKFVTSGIGNSDTGNIPIVMSPNLSIKPSLITSTSCQEETQDVNAGAWREEALIELPTLSSFEETSKYQSCPRNEKKSLFASTSSNKLSEGGQKSLKGTSKTLISHSGSQSGFTPKSEKSNRKCIASMGRSKLNEAKEWKRQSAKEIQKISISTEDIRVRCNELPMIDYTQNTETCSSEEKVIPVKIKEDEISKPSSNSKDKMAVNSKKRSKVLRRTSTDNMNSKADERNDKKSTNFKSKPKDDNTSMRKEIKKDTKENLETNETSHISGSGEQNSEKKQHLVESTPLLEIKSQTEQNGNTPMCSQTIQKILPDFQEQPNDDSDVNRSKERINAAGLIETQEETCGHCSEVNAQKMLNENTTSSLPKSNTAEDSTLIKCQQKIPEPAVPGPSNTTKSQNISEVDNASKCPKKVNKNLTSTGAIPKKLQLSSDSKFLKGFNPDQSRRETKKFKKLDERYKKARNYHKKRLYDDHGLVLETGEDLCDCLIKDCPGCHFPCPRCRSNKCGHVCRVNRTWMYDEYEIEGTGITIKRQP